MLEQEFKQIESICDKAEALIKELISVKIWYKRITIACLVFMLTGIAGGGVVIYKQNKMEKAIAQAVPRSTIIMLDDVYSAQTRAMINLAEGKYQEALNKFEVDCATIRSQIIMWNSEINTRGSENSK